MNINEITTDAVMALNPCDEYPAERIEALVQRLSTETPFEVLLSIPFDDALWFLATALPKPERVQWAEACARRVKAYADGTEADAADAADAAANAAAYWAGRAAHYAARAAHYAARAAYYAARAAHYAARAAYYAGGIAAQRAEQHLAIRHGLMLLGAL